MTGKRRTAFITGSGRNIGRAVIFADGTLYDTRGKEAARAIATLAINPRKAPAS